MKKLRIQGFTAEVNTVDESFHIPSVGPALPVQAERLHETVFVDGFSEGAESGLEELQEQRILVVTGKRRMPAESSDAEGSRGFSTC
jgi:hypothetical protein